MQWVPGRSFLRPGNEASPVPVYEQLFDTYMYMYMKNMLNGCGKVLVLQSEVSNPVQRTYMYICTCTCTCTCTVSLFLSHGGYRDSIFLNHKGCADSIFPSR